MEGRIREFTGAQIVIEEIIRQGTTTVFGYPGGAVIPLYDAIYEYYGKIQHILTAHEQGASHAADGYARTKGEVGVVIATSGPGATNLVTGIANAYLDSVPLVAITGNVPVPLLGKDSFQEVDIVGITQPVVKHNFVIRDIAELPRTLRKAFHIARTGRKGPVLVDIPKDIQVDKFEYDPSEEIDLFEREKPLPQFNEADMAKAIEVINKSERPFIYAGGGILTAGVEEDLLTLSKKIDGAIGFSMMGITAVDYNYPLNLGMCGMHGKYASNMAQEECDVMIAIGVRFSDRATGDVGHYVKNKHIIHLDIDLAEMGKNIEAQTNVLGDIRDSIKALIDGVEEKSREEWTTLVNNFKEKAVKHTRGEFIPREIIKTVSKYMDDETVVATDVGQHQMWTVQHYEFRKPRTLLTSGGLGTMGFGMGAAIGGCMASGKKTVLFTGDGSFGMNLNEFATAVTEKLPLVIILLNNKVLGMVRQWQDIFQGGRFSSTTTNRKTNFVAVAEAFGAKGYKVESIDELEELLQTLKVDGPVLIECPIDKGEKVYPMIPPGGAVKDIILE